MFTILVYVTPYVTVKFGRISGVINIDTN